MMTNEEWEEFYPLFTQKEFMCKCGKCGLDSANNMDIRVLHLLMKVRTATGVRMFISSGWRCEDHPAEKSKSKPGTHYLGLAFDVRCSNDVAFVLLKELMLHDELLSIRFAQKGPHGERFIHGDLFDRGYKHVGSY